MVQYSALQAMHIASRQVGCPQLRRSVLGKPFGFFISLALGFREKCLRDIFPPLLKENERRVVVCRLASFQASGRLP